MGEIHYFVEMGAEGGNSSVRAIDRWALWNEGTVSRRENGSAAFNPVSGGAADWGNLYALTSFNDTKNNRRVEWGWAPEDMGDFALTQQGFQGCMALPRERFVHVTKGVQDVNDELTQPGNFRATRQADGTYTSYTLGVMPLNEVVRAITKRARRVKVDHRRGRCDRPKKLMSSSSNHFKLYAELTDVTGPAGFQVGVSPDGSEYTNIYFNPSNYTINVDRMHSSLINQFANFTNVGYFYPYTIAGKTEPLRMTVFLDGSLLEIYVNDRFSLTTRIYPSRADSTGFGLYVAQGASAEVKHLEAYDGLLNVWPDRPLNSSSPLVFDTPEETNNYTWWPGN
ncbi:hypothetical protein H2201_008312 [Coniosporium apollinis]|uniref:Glycosyl hydrolase family 32 C-terminal domain-containing protein n=1 Tax=Coniosporium apollinis TaxID=61459 RepID=A0ABQ9NKS1_9PEZI|nr:hypothetical protein H2201_008312 [Coniosporium apollinis]